MSTRALIVRPVVPVALFRPKTIKTRELSVIKTELLSHDCFGDFLCPDRCPSHFNLAETLEWLGRMKPKRAIITNMHVDLDYETLRRELPENAVPAYDGMMVEFT